MELPGNFLLGIHIAAGCLTLIAGPLAIFFNFRDARNHRRAGKTFFYAMLVVCVTAVAGFFRRPESLFYQFLLGIAVLVLAGLLRGVRAMRFMQGAAVGKLDYAYTGMLGICGTGMLGMAVWLGLHGSNPAFPVLFGVFGGLALADTIANFRLFSRAAQLRPNDWYRLHVGSMLGAFTASTTAFTVNTAHFLPWYLQWFGPALLLLPLQIYFGRKAHRAPAV